MYFETILPKKLHYTYSVISNLVRIFFFCAVIFSFGDYGSNFESTTASLLVLLYITVTGAFAGNALEMLNQNLIMCIGVQNKSEAEEELLKELHEKIKFQKNKLYITGVANLVIYLVAIVTILYNLN